MFSLKSKFRKLIPQEKSGKPYILPTLYGIGFLFLIVDIFALGYWRDNAPYHTVGLTLIVFGLVAMIHTNANIQNVRVEVDSCEPSAAGDYSELHFRVNSLGDVPSHNLCFELDKGFKTETKMLADLSRETYSTLTIQSEKRGVYPIKRIKVLSRSVYGLFKAWTWQSTDVQLVVYPKPRGSLPLPTGENAEAKKLDGEMLAARAKVGDDFQGHKAYVQGQSLQHVDWKAYARGQDMLVKDYSGESSEALDLHWKDTRGGTEERLEQLSAWIVMMNRLQRPYSLHLPKVSIPRGSGTKHDESAFFALASHSEV